MGRGSYREYNTVGEFMSENKDEIKKCKDCKHCATLSTMDGSLGPGCVRNVPPRVDYYSGKLIRRGTFCQPARADYACGPEAKFFEPTRWAKFKAFFKGDK